MIMLVLEEHDLDRFVEKEVQEPEEEEARVNHKKEMIKAKRIITDSIKDNLIPQVSSLKTPKSVFDALTQMFKGRNINRKMTLRSQLKNIKMQGSETIRSYFTRVSQIKEQLEAIEDMVQDAEVVMTTLNGLPRSWEGFLHGICTRRKMTKFSRLWEECTQEEARREAREEKMETNEDQDLAAYTKKGKGKKEPQSPKRPPRSNRSQMRKRYFSQIRCFSCQKLGHIQRFCPHAKEQGKKGKFKKHHAHAAKDDELVQRRQEEDSEEEYTLISALTGTITHGSDTWLIDSGASKHMTGNKEVIVNLIQKDSPQKVKLGDDYQYLIKGGGEAVYNLESGKWMRMK